MREGRWTIGALLTWTATGLLLLFLERPLYDALWIMIASIFLVYVLAGAILLLFTVAYAAQRRNWVAAASAFGFALCSLILWQVEPVVSQAGDTATFRIRFSTNRATYDRIVAEVERSLGSVPPHGERWGIRFQVDAGPPVRVAFRQPGGLLDNWEGVVYDPTGLVSQAQGWRSPGEFSAPPDIKQLFGGDLVSCRHVEKSYYRCWFT